MGGGGRFEPDARTIAFAQTSKNKKVPHELWISDRLMEILNKLKAKRGLSKVVGPYVFQKLDGKPYGEIRTAWSAACRRAGVANANIHDLRHKAVTDMIKAGTPVAQVKNTVGHSEISTTMGYTHLSAEDTKEAVNSLSLSARKSGK